MSCVVKGLLSSTKADYFPFCTAQCTRGPTRYPKYKEQLVCMYLATCKLVNALSCMNPVEEGQGCGSLFWLLASIGYWSCTQGREVQSAWEFFVALRVIFVVICFSTVQVYICMYICVFCNCSF